jgi:hypothetical protein
MIGVANPTSNLQARWLRHADRHLRHLFPYLPGQSGYNKRLRRAAGLLRHVIRVLATDTALWTDDVWLVGSTPIECGRHQPPWNRSSSRWGGPSSSAGPEHPEVRRPGHVGQGRIASQLRSSWGMTADCGCACRPRAKCHPGADDTAGLTAYR